MDMNFSVFEEPKGVMRILHFIFSICAFATMCNYHGFIQFLCAIPYEYGIEYPFNLLMNNVVMNAGNTTIPCHPTVTLLGNYESDAKYFVATGVIAMLYSILICVVYTKFDDLYKNNKHIPLADFALSVFIAVLWLSSSACWANSLSGIKHITNADNIDWNNISEKCTKCPIKVESFNTLNISVLLGFLNFFLWASDLWFLYKETSWFQNTKITSPIEN